MATRPSLRELQQQRLQQNLVATLGRIRNPQEGQVEYATYGDSQMPMIYLGGQWHQYGPTWNMEHGRQVGDFTPSEELLSLLTRDNLYSSGIRKRDQTQFERVMSSGPINQYISAHDYTQLPGFLNLLDTIAAGGDVSAFTRVTGDPGDSFRGSAKNWGLSYLLGDLLGTAMSGGLGQNLRRVDARQYSDDTIIAALNAIGRPDVLYGYKQVAGAPVREKLFEFYDQLKQAFPDADIPNPDQLALQNYLSYIQKDGRGYVESVSHEQIFADVLDGMINSAPLVEARGGRFDLMSIPEISKMVADGQAAAYARHKARRDAEKSGGLLNKVLPIAAIGLNFIPGFQGMSTALGQALGASGAAATALGGSIIHTGVGLAGGKNWGDAILSGVLSGSLPVLGREFLPTTWGDALGAGEDGWNIFGFEVGKNLAGTAIGETLGGVASAAINSALAEYNASKDFEKLQKDINEIYARFAAQQQKAAAAQAETGITSPGWGNNVSFTGGQQPSGGVPTGVGTDIGTSTDPSISVGDSPRIIAQGGEGGMGTEEAALFDAPEGPHYTDPYQTIELIPGQAGRALAQRANRGWGRSVSFV